MRIMTILALSLFLSLPAGAQNRAANSSATQTSSGSVTLAKLKLRRQCPADQIRCACADTGTSACCTSAQRCACAPVANCQ